LKLFGSRLGGIVNIANKIEGAELIAPEDWDQLKRKITDWLIAGAPLPESAASEMARRYCPGIIAKRHLEIYDEVLSTRA
jgi:hypothetical protein